MDTGTSSAQTSRRTMTVCCATLGGMAAGMMLGYLIRRAEAIAGVKATTLEGGIDIEADLTVACDGRHSLVRERAGLEVEEIGAPMDVLWFRAGKAPNENERVFARVDPGKMMVTFD